MKKIFYLIFLFGILFMISSVALSQEDIIKKKVIIYYFHGSFRCVTCNNMENYTKAAIETNFKNALALGKLEFKTVNVEEKANEHFTRDYKLYTKSLILSLVDSGKEIKSKNLNKIWELSRDQQKFIAYVTEEIKQFLKEIK
ncbi:MAG: nitrophenyl compound nitroreductase subunit ArsF family protein [Candidatus Omnitrophota bacterium]